MTKAIYDDVVTEIPELDLLEELAMDEESLINEEEDLYV
jgi:hypothetical protein